MSFAINRSAGLLLALLAAPLVDCGTPAGAEIPWQRRPEDVLQSARSSGKPILVFVTATWCHYCKKMKSETWADQPVETMVSQNFETLLLDGDRDQRIVSKLGLRGFPATLVYGADGQFVAMRPGFMPGDQLLDWLSSLSK